MSERRRPPQKFVEQIGIINPGIFLGLNHNSSGWDALLRHPLASRRRLDGCGIDYGSCICACTLHYPTLHLHYTHYTRTPRYVRADVCVWCVCPVCMYVYVCVCADVCVRVFYSRDRIRCSCLRHGWPPAFEGAFMFLWFFLSWVFRRVGMALYWRHRYWYYCSWLIGRINHWSCIGWVGSGYSFQGRGIRAHREGVEVVITLYSYNSFLFSILFLIDYFFFLFFFFPFCLSFLLWLRGGREVIHLPTYLPTCLPTDYLGSLGCTDG
ncbi:hypothetical protein GGS21DRAFT_45782 [Xylaria nigripes]|nr:hypothetical protein GGS21DRAFT_45782 [Xylaria nigripes]